jgi:hypothetical protein
MINTFVHCLVAQLRPFLTLQQTNRFWDPVMYAIDVQPRIMNFEVQKKTKKQDVYGGFLSFSSFLSPPSSFYLSLSFSPFVSAWMHDAVGQSAVRRGCCCAIAGLELPAAVDVRGLGARVP